MGGWVRIDEIRQDTVVDAAAREKMMTMMTSMDLSFKAASHQWWRF